MINRILSITLVILSMLGCMTKEEKGSVGFIELLTESRENPEGTGVEKPRFSWKLSGNGQDILQTAYKIEVAATEKDLKDGKNLVWNSGKVESGQSLFVEYAGSKLEAGKKYFWRATVWTNKGDENRSSIRHFSMAIDDHTHFDLAKWIGINALEKVEDNRTMLPARYLRQEFKTEAKKIVRATLYISGVGSSVPYINGKQVGNDIFGPLPTWYDASVPYLTYDVTDMIKKGKNVIGVVLGNGRFLTMRERGMVSFGVPRLCSVLTVEYEKGSDRFVTDGTWKVTDRGPITENSEFDGEKYDARLELGKWTETGYDDSAWSPAEMMEAPKGKLTAQPSKSLKVMEEIKPVSIKSVDGGRYIVDMGQNMVGILNVKLNVKKDKPVTMKFAEVLKPDGNELYLDNIRSAKVTDIYTPAKDGRIVWEPTFTYHGFQFVEISGLDDEPKIDDFTGKVIYDEMATTGTFESSDEMLNKIYKNAYWGIRGNYRGMPTDCPQRDERLGWLGDRATGAYGESFIFNNSLMYAKWLKDIEESMNEAGSISVVSPRYWTIFNDDVTWPSAFFYIADMLYSQFGDDKPIRERYPAMKKWVEHIASAQMKDYIVLKDTYGDWCMPPERPELIHSEDPSRKTRGEVLSTTVYYSILQLMQKFAVMSGAPQDVDGYKDLAAKIKEAYNKKFFDPKTAQYDNNTVTANILSLQLGLVPEGYEASVFQNIVDKTEGDCNGHVSAGVLGIQHLMRGLTQHGNLELAYRIVTNTTYPSWGYMVENGATTIWELWNGDTANPAMNSRNHVMLLGDLIIWYYENLAGIRNDPSGVGFKKILMEPAFPEKLGFVNASFDSPYGKTVSSWKRDSDRLSWDITVPANTTATVVLPKRFGIKPEQNSAGIHHVKESDGKIIIELGSGKYSLKSPE